MAKVLVVEDDRNTLSGLVEILTDEGHETVGCAGAKSALYRLERDEFDILLTDLRMPDMDGIELYEHSLPIAPDMKTIVITAYSSVRDVLWKR